MQKTVLNALTSLSHLQDFQLILSWQSEFQLQQLDRLSGLKKISIDSSTNLNNSMIGGIQEVIAKSPELAHLEFITTIYRKSKTATLHDLLSKVPQGSPLRLTHLVLRGPGISACIDSHTIPHLRSLAYLNLDYLSPDTSTIPEIYARLNREKIHLKQVVLNSVNDAILDYLGSYSGLETLDLFKLPLSFNSEKEPEALSQRFYKSVLPKHVNSIQALNIQPRYEGGWCYDVDDVSVVLAQCKKLKSLSVALTSTATVTDNSLEPPYCTKSYFPKYHYRDNFDNMVCFDDHFTVLSSPIS
jgi:hypothetical protein